MGRSGIWQKNLSGDAEYESFVPSPLPPFPAVELNSKMHELLIIAHKRLALLDGLSSRIPNVNLFISMYVRKEALMSSQIEGTQATLEDILDPSIDENANQNVAEVIDYIKALKYAIGRLNDLPLCNRLIKKTHAILMKNARGQEKTPGEFRRSQNWIGGAGSTLRTARYIPPSPECMDEAMSRLEWFMNRNEDFGSLDVLVRLALIHYQFETIHPFLDGNGRIGRLLIILYLMDKGVISTPALYISYFLKRNRIEYYDRLMHVREEGNYEQWITFFLTAVKDSAEDAVAAIDKLTDLRKANMKVLAGIGHPNKNLKRVFAYLEENPIIEIQKTAVALGIAYNTVASAINRLLEAGILEQTENVRRNRTFSYKAYMDILRDGT